MILKIYTSLHRKACTKNAFFFKKLVHGKLVQHVLKMLVFSKN